jgi:hypothetical protein
MKSQILVTKMQVVNGSNGPLIYQTLERFSNINIENKVTFSIWNYELRVVVKKGWGSKF